LGMKKILAPFIQEFAVAVTVQEKGPHAAARHPSEPSLERRFDLKSPGFQERLGNVLGVLVLARPLAQSGRANKLVRLKLKLLHHLFKFSDRRDNRSNGFRLSPVRVAASLCHD